MSYRKEKKMLKLKNERMILTLRLLNTTGEFIKNIALLQRSKMPITNNTGEAISINRKESSLPLSDDIIIKLGKQ